MTEEQTVAREKELRKTYVGLFSYPTSDIKEGEMYLGDAWGDAVLVQIGIYRQNGLPSVRHGARKEFPGKPSTYPIFVQVKEFVRVESAYKHIVNL